MPTRPFLTAKCRLNVAVGVIVLSAGLAFGQNDGCPPILFAECPAIDFEDHAVGVQINTQYGGITFSSIGICGTTNAIIAAAAPTASPTHALGTISPAPCEFSQNYLRMSFAQPQQRVSFFAGSAGGADITVRAFNSGGGTVFGPLTFDPGAGVLRYVLVETATPVMTRIEVRAANDDGEYIDDLRIEDTTPPEVDIFEPTYRQCICDSVQVRGRLCDPEGMHYDRLDVQYASSDPNWPWWQVGEFYESPVCNANGGLLYTWTPSEPLTNLDGDWRIRLTGINDCGHVCMDEELVKLDRAFATALISSPAHNSVVGGTVCINGWVDDNCFEFYRVEYQPAGGGPFQLIVLGNAPVVNGSLATWDTAAVPDGAYNIRLHGQSECAQVKQAQRLVVVDNTQAEAILTSPTNCDLFNLGAVEIRGTANDANFARYELAYVGGAANDWTGIVEKLVPVAGPNGLLHTWDVSGLEPCTYVVRLRVITAVVLDCGCTTQSTDAYAVLTLGLAGDIDLDCDVDQADLGALLANFGLDCD